MASRRLLPGVSALSTAATRGGRRLPARGPPPPPAPPRGAPAAAAAAASSAAASAGGGAPPPAAPPSPLLLVAVCSPWTGAPAAAAAAAGWRAAGAPRVAPVGLWRGLASTAAAAPPPPATAAATSPPPPTDATDATDAADGSGSGGAPPPRLATPDGWASSAFTDTATATLEAVADALAEAGLEALPGWDVELSAGVLRIEVGEAPPPAAPVGGPDGSSGGGVGGGAAGGSPDNDARPAVPTGGVYVLNLQTPNRQIWVSSPVSGPARYGWAVDGGGWYACRGGGGLWALLLRELGGGLSVPPGEV